jgi:DNA helicase-2/ATP-dependent DNA helicase PcrA
VHNPLDELAMERIINVPPRGIGPKAWSALESWSNALSLPKWATLELIKASNGSAEGVQPLDTRTLNALNQFHDPMAAAIAVREELPASQLLDVILDAFGYESWLRDGSEENEERWDNVLELSTVARDFDALEPREGLGLLLQSVALVSDVDSMETAQDRVTLLTLHSAKGLEFPVVMITGVEEGILPHNRSVDDTEALSEERRLFYVGITRAMRRVHLVHAFRRTVFGRQDIRQPSRFLSDLPSELLEIDGESVVPAPRKPRAVTWPAPEPAAPSKAQEFQGGDRVEHAHFGTGVVVASRLRDGDEEVTVAFANFGVKRFMQTFAKLVKLDPSD